MPDNADNRKHMDITCTMVLLLDKLSVTHHGVLSSLWPVAHDQQRLESLEILLSMLTSLHEQQPTQWCHAKLLH